MKKLIVLTAVALLGFGSLSAQRTGGHQRLTVEEQVGNLKKELNLTDEQTEKITVLYTDYRKKMQEAGEGSREKMRGEREKLDKQVEALLTDEQKTAFQKMRQQRRGPGRGQKKN